MYLTAQLTASKTFLVMSEVTHESSRKNKFASEDVIMVFNLIPGVRIFKVLMFSTLI